MVTRENVSEAAAWLDREKPGWDRLVNTGLLNIESGRYCVLGQVFAQEAAARGPGRCGEAACWCHNGYGYAVKHKDFPLAHSSAFADRAARSYWLQEISARLYAAQQAAWAEARSAAPLPEPEPEPEPEDELVGV